MGNKENAPGQPDFFYNDKPKNLKDYFLTNNFTNTKGAIINYVNLCPQGTKKPLKEFLEKYTKYMSKYYNKFEEIESLYLNLEGMEL